MSNVAVNDAGDVMIFREGAWSRAPVAQNDQGARLFYDGTDWKNLPTASPAAPAVPAAPRASFGQRFATGLGDIFRGAEQLTANINDGRQNRVMDFLRQNPNIAPIMEQAAATVPMETAAEANARIAEREKTYQESRGPDPSIDWARIGGQVISTLPVGMAAAPTRLLPAVASGSLQGAALGGLQPVTEGDYGEGVTGNVLLGAGAGAAGGAASYGFGRLLQGRQAPSARPEAVALSDAGVSLTPGQIAGGYGQRIEEALGSIPIVGAQIRGQQAEGVASFNRAVANRVLEPLGQKVDDAAPVGRELVDDVYKRIVGAYNAVLPRVQAFGPDQQLYQDFAQAFQMAGTKKTQEDFVDIFNNKIAPLIKGGVIDGDSWKSIDEQLGFEVRRYLRSTDPSHQNLGDALVEAQRALRDLLARSNPQIAPEVKAADQAYAQYIRMERAAGATGAREGVFTPLQFNQAVAMTAGGPRRSQYARGDALMQDLSDPASVVMPRTLPDSGTTERALIAAALLGGPSALGMGAPAVAAGAGASALYFNPVQRLLQSGLLGNRPAMVSSAGRQLAPIGGPSLAAALLAPSNNQQSQ
jgi:hypothetical protein